jgi:hypothetical protein
MQIVFRSLFLFEQITHKSLSAMLKQFLQKRMLFLSDFILSPKSSSFSLSVFHKYKTSRSASFGPMEGREEK